MARAYKFRVPRQRGLTELCRTYNLSTVPEQKKALKKKVINVILDNYIQNGFTVLGIPISIPDLSQMFNITTKEVYEGITRTARHLGDLVNDQESLQNTYGALLSLTLNQAMAITGAARHQTISLQTAKNGRLWVPGLDKDLTASISAEGKNITNLLLLAKHLSGRDGNSTTVDITNQTLIQQEAQGGNYIGPNEAIILIGKGTQPLLESDNMVEGLEDRYGTKLLPEVIATKQHGLKDDGTFAVQDREPKKSNHVEGRRGDIEES